jgi:hypothetical protein
MSEYRWILQGPEGAEIRTSDAFGSQEDAEAWMGSEWQQLVTDGGAFVVLTSDGTTVYRMSLADA